MALFGRSISRLDELKRAVSKDPTSRHFLALADEYRRAGKLREAAETLENGLRENPGYVAAYVALGRIHQLSQSFDEAITAFQAALGTDRDNLVAIRQLADCFLKKGEKVEAIKKLKLFRGLQPGDREVEELIQQLEIELSAPKPLPTVRSETWPSILVTRPATPSLDAPPVTASSRPLDDLPTPLALPTESIEVQPPQETEPISLGSVLPSRSEEIFDLTNDGSSTGDSSREEIASRESFLEGPEGRRVPSARELETAPLAPVAVVAREVENEPALFETESRGGEIPILEAAGVIGVDGQSAPPVITETLAELYRTQGYVADARQTYQGLAEAERDPARAREFRDRAAQLPAAAKRGPAQRLREWATNLPSPPPARIEDLGRVLETLVESVPGVRAAALTDREGLPLAVAGDDISSSGMESLIAELTAFWKSVHRTRDEVGAGLLSSLTLSATDGAAIVSAVSSEYSLILRVDRAVPLGRIRYEAARTAGIVRPALG